MSAHLSYLREFTRLVQLTDDEASWQAGEALIQTIESLLPLLDLKLIVLNKLREQLVAALDQGATDAANAKARKRAGRRKDPEVAHRDQKMLDAWESGQYKTYGQLGQEFDMKSDATRKAIVRAKRLRKQ